MPNTLPIPIDRPIAIELITTWGPDFATVQVVGDATHREAPVHLGAAVPVPGYGACLAQATRSLLPTQVPLRAAWGGDGMGVFHELPELEIFIGAQNQTVGEYLVAQGWAIPSAELLEHSPRRETYLDALRSARATHAGVWGEITTTATSVGLDPSLDAASVPPAHRPAWIVEAAVLSVLLLAMAVGLRDQSRRPAPAEAPRPRPKSRFPGQEFGGRAVRFYFSGLFPARPSAPARPSPPDPSSATTNPTTSAESPA